MAAPLYGEKFTGLCATATRSSTNLVGALSIALP
jgi:hypothetical protein